MESEKRSRQIWAALENKQIITLQHFNGIKLAYISAAGRFRVMLLLMSSPNLRYP